MSIDADFRLRQGAFANIRLASNVGAINRFVDLTQGDGPELADGATLGPSQTDQPVDLDLAVSTLDPRTRAEAARLLAGLDAATRERGADLDRTLRHSAEALGETADLLAEVTADRRALQQLVAQGRVVVGALAREPDDLGATAERSATTLDAAAGRQAELAPDGRRDRARARRRARRRSTGSRPRPPTCGRWSPPRGPAVAELAPTARGCARRSRRCGRWSPRRGG